MREYQPRRPAGRVENYTTAFLWSAGLVLFMGLVALWASFGYLAALLGAGVIRLAIGLLPRAD
ncbi:hypothetical protein [uncultured Litoreibacter sp.]|uniref:hypothetical protein n=1 Tax=uncultured Litoreibacter sp. TaxID=1392394 RepID=UPI0026337033|nr:hypothetical protein [uncultured Litoreibacter sp.]